MSVEAVWESAAYCAALTVYSIETKCDEADQELAELLTASNWLKMVVISVLMAYAPKPPVKPVDHPSKDRLLGLLPPQ